MINLTHDPIEAIDTMAAGGEDIYETAVALGQSTEEEISVRRWVLGDLATRVCTTYGDETISKYAAAINVNSSTLKQRRQMSEYYPQATRTAYASLGYSHYRAAIKFGDLAKSLAALEKCEAKQWPVFRFEQLLTRLLGKRRNADSVEAVVTRAYSQEDGHYFVIKTNVELKTGQVITIKLK